ncbi:MAG: NUDIX domain-containing protein [Alphaproteobacteria bacterium]|nr:NUDIX domain-containing protein [Alphaproteobacteria bacterium]
MVQVSAGLLLYRRRDGLEVFLVHPGGPFWAKKDVGAWSVPKGLVRAGEEPLAAALREFAEEAGPVPAGEVFDLGAFRQPSRKIIRAFALEGQFDPSKLKSNRFKTEWPPHSGRLEAFPEIDRGDWFGLDDARLRILKGQAAILDALEKRIGR